MGHLQTTEGHALTWPELTEIARQHPATYGPREPVIYPDGSAVVTAQSTVMGDYGVLSVRCAWPLTRVASHGLCGGSRYAGFGVERCECVCHEN